MTSRNVLYNPSAELAGQSSPQRFYEQEFIIRIRKLLSEGANHFDFIEQKLLFNYFTEILGTNTYSMYI